MPTSRVEFLDLQFDRLTLKQVISKLRKASSATPYGYVVTPNVDHVVRLHREPELRPLYQAAALCLCDSRILRTLARMAGLRLPLAAGSDLAAGLFERVLNAGDTIVVVGSSKEFIDKLQQKYREIEFLHHAPPMGLRHDRKARRKAAEFVAAANARFAFITVGSPQQEMVASEVAELAGASGIALCVGAGLEFLTGEQKRAPKVLQRLGLEWAHRLASNPRRLWRRYLLEGPRIFPLFLRWSIRKRPARTVAATVGLIALAAAPAVLFSGHAWPYGQSSQTMRIPRSAGVQPEPLNLPPPDLLRPLSPEDAARENAERPFTNRPDTPASKFVLRSDTASKERAVDCLAQAVYYEAGSEGADGERAVAQVVLNRMRHPGYPSSVCGVVYQGSERATGCQFTFTCDGSLLRPPAPALFAQARRIAQEALAGRIFAPVGHATHYHADFVLPYWADSLDKSVQIGRHIFYRLRSSLGDARAFSQRYAGSEPEVRAPGTAVVLSSSEMTQELASALISDGLNGPAKDVEKAGQPPASALVADLTKGTLVSESAPLARGQVRASPTQDCAAKEPKRITPIGPADLRAGGGASAC